MDYSGTAYGTRTRLFCLKGRGSHPKSNAVYLAEGVGPAPTSTGFKDQCLDYFGLPPIDLSTFCVTCLQIFTKLIFFDLY